MVALSITHIVEVPIIVLLVIVTIAILISGKLLLRFIRLKRAVYSGLQFIRDNPSIYNYKEFDVSKYTGKELNNLAKIINYLVNKLVHAGCEHKEVIVALSIQKTFMNPMLERSEEGKTLSTGTLDSPLFRLFGYHESIDPVSGDFFNFLKLDENHYAMIQLNISGHGINASIIKAQIAALFVDYFMNVRNMARSTGNLQYNLREFVLKINEFFYEFGFSGRFAVFNLLVINFRTGEYKRVMAGSNPIRIYKAKDQKIKIIPSSSPSAGTLDPSIFDIKPTIWKVTKGKLNSGDILFLCRDGFEESYRFLRDKNFNMIEYKDTDRELREKDQLLIDSSYVESSKPGHEAKEVKTATLDEKVDIDMNDQFRKSVGFSKYRRIHASENTEEFDETRIHDIIEKVMSRGQYILYRRVDATIDKPLHFNFSSLKGTGEECVLALISVEKVFRIIPDRSGGHRSKVRVDKKIDSFLEACFVEFKEFYNNPIQEEPGYIYYSHLREDDQSDDLCVWAYEQK